MVANVGADCQEQTLDLKLTTALVHILYVTHWMHNHRGFQRLCPYTSRRLSATIEAIMHRSHTKDMMIGFAIGFTNLPVVSVCPRVYAKILPKRLA
jgi:hypothetical protein